MEKEKFLEILSKIKGFFGEDEAYALKNFVSSINLDGPIVEIGSYMGRSTFCIGLGILENKNPNKPYLFAIDHFLGSEEHQPGKSHESTEILKYGTTFLSFHNNIKENKLDEIVLPIATSSAVANKIVTSINKEKTFSFLFIDADHSYDGVKTDFELWEPYVKDGGYIAIHDIAYINKKGEHVDKFPGVTRFYNEIDKNKYKEVFNIGSSLRIVKKV